MYGDNNDISKVVEGDYIETVDSNYYQNSFGKVDNN